MSTPSRSKWDAKALGLISQSRKSPDVVVSFWRAETKSLPEQMRDLHSPVAWHLGGWDGYSVGFGPHLDTTSPLRAP
jgi:hypothetical protein